MSKIKLVSCEVTDLCNLRCKHCYVAKKSDKELDTQGWQKIFKTLHTAGVEHITVTGGEPLIRPDVEVLIRSIKKYGITCAITTNGLLLNEQKILALKRIGVDAIQISIEGEEAHHDYIRGAGTYKKAMENIALLHKYKMNFSTMTTLTSKNYKSIDKIVAMLRKNHVQKISFEKYLYNGCNDRKLILKPESGRYILNRIIYYQKRNVNVGLNDPIKNVLLQNNAVNQYGGCLAGLYTCAISAKGKLKLCSKIPLTFGYCTLSNLNKFEKYSPVNKIVNREYHNCKCAHCKYLSICGGCRAEAYFNGDILGQDISCWYK